MSGRLRGRRVAILVEDGYDAREVDDLEAFSAALIELLVLSWEA